MIVSSLLCMMYPIVVFGNESLRQTSQDVEHGTEVKELVNDMFETMYNANGVGLAAPQIGKNINLIVIDFYHYVPKDQKKKVAMINPQITVFEDSEDVLCVEGCLSLPGIAREVSRKNKIKVHYFDEEWIEHDEIYEGVAARIVQHECDHLIGKLFIDYDETDSIKGKLEDIKNRRVKTQYKTV